VLLRDLFMQVLVLKFRNYYTLDTLDTYGIGRLGLHTKVTTFGLISTWFFVVVTRQKERGFAGAGRANHQHVVIPRFRHMQILFGLSGYQASSAVDESRHPDSMPYHRRQKVLPTAKHHGENTP